MGEEQSKPVKEKNEDSDDDIPQALKYLGAAAIGAAAAGVAYAVYKSYEEEGLMTTTFEKPLSWNMEPDSASATKSDSYQLFPIGYDKKSLEECEMIENLFFETMPRHQFRITKIQRVQNIDLYTGYQFQKKKMLKQSGKVAEKLLFHGTKRQYIDAICRQGFDFRISGASTGTLYGKGSYFAKSAWYSRRYTDSQQLIIANVLVGRYTRGYSSLVRPPPLRPNDPLGDLYDSCVDDENDPKIFVVFQHEQAYPEYLIDFKRI